MGLLTAGIDVGSSSVKLAVVETDGAGLERLVLGRTERLRRRDPTTVATEAWADMLAGLGLAPGDLAYVATTGHGHGIPFRRGHFYSMTTHARGALFLVPGSEAALDVGALHAKAILMDRRGKVLGYRMTSQCASGSGQFLENIARYLGVALEEIGSLSRRAASPEAVSSICAVLAETDVINMVSRGIPREDILKGIHLSMGGRFLKLLRGAKVTGRVAVTGGLAEDVGLLATLAELAAREAGAIELVAHPQAILAGAIGAGLWGAYRHRVLADRAAAGAA